jgi:hypothetical protein
MVQLLGNVKQWQLGGGLAYNCLLTFLAAGES